MRGAIHPSPEGLGFLASKDKAKEKLKKMLRDSPKEAEIILTQLFTLIKETGASDMKFGENFSFIESGKNQGKLAFFDTEPFDLDSIHLSHPSKSLEELYYSDFHRNIYFLGGLRNLDLALGDAVNRGIVYGAEGVVFLDDQDWSKVRKIYWKVKAVTLLEMSSNFVKTWTLRLLFPATVCLALAIPHFQKYN